MVDPVLVSSFRRDKPRILVLSAHILVRTSISPDRHVASYRNEPERCSVHAAARYKALNEQGPFQDDNTVNKKPTHQLDDAPGLIPQISSWPSLELLKFVILCVSQCQKWSIFSPNAGNFVALKAISKWIQLFWKRNVSHWPNLMHWYEQWMGDINSNYK